MLLLGRTENAWILTRDRMPSDNVVSEKGLYTLWRPLNDMFHTQLG